MKKPVYFRDEVGRGALAADPSGTVHQHSLVSEQVQVLVDVVREVTEFPDVWGQAMRELPLGGHVNGCGTIVRSSASKPELTILLS